MEIANSFEGPVSIIGLGYIGLPTALMFSAHGVDVVGTDCNAELVNRLNVHSATFDEPGLAEMFETARANGIQFTTSYPQTDIYIIAVPTPYDRQTKKIDPSYVVEAVRSVIAVCKLGAVIVIESTIAPGTIKKHVLPMIEGAGLTVGRDVHVVHAPERIIPGAIVSELQNNSRTIGSDDLLVGSRVKALYSSFCRGNIVLTDVRTAEMSKVVENTYRDVNIAFANELAKICRSDDLNVYEIIRIANMHPRVNILQPGPGVGGHCISVDPWFLVGDYPSIAILVRSARQVNDSMPSFVLDRILAIMEEEGVSDLGRVGLYGLTYKENVDDIRESPTLQLLSLMSERHAGLPRVYDPHVKRTVVNNQYHGLADFLDDLDFVIVMVGHNEIRQNQHELRGKIVLDTRNVVTLEGIHRL